MYGNALTYELAVRQIDDNLTRAERRLALRAAHGQSQSRATVGTSAVRRLVGGAMIAAGSRVHGQVPAAVGQVTLGAAR